MYQVSLKIYMDLELVFSYDENFLTYKSYSLKEKDKVVTAEKVSDGILKLAVSSSDNSNIKSSLLTTLNFVAKKSGNTQVTLLEAVLIDSGMGYTKYNDLNKNVSLSIKAKNSGGGSSGGGGGSGRFNNRWRRNKLYYRGFSYNGTFK